MKFPKLDYQKIAMQTVGEAAGLYSLGLLGKINKVATAKPGFKGAIYKAVSIFGKHFLAGKVKKGNDVIEGASSALSVAGTSQLMAAFMPGKVPVIGGYEDYALSGPGVEMEGVDDEGNDDGPNGVEGYEQEIMQ